MARLRELALGVNELASDSGFEVYPNPATSELHIQNSQQLAIDQITISDSNGKQVLSQRSGFENVDIKNLYQGLYFLYIHTANGKHDLKFIKK